MVDELFKEMAQVFFDEKDKRIHTELRIFCVIALAIGIANLLIRGAKAKLEDKKSRKL